MANDTLLGLLALDDDRLRPWIDGADDLDEPLGDRAHSISGRLGVELSSSALQLGGTPASGWARIGATAAFHGTGWAYDVYSTGHPCPFRTKANVGVLDLEAALGSSLRASTDLSGGTLGLRASLGAGLRYRHFLPVLGDRRRDTAYRKLVTGCRLPQLVDLGQPLEIGEVHRLDVKLAADLGVEAKVGRRLAEDLVVELSDGLSIPFETDVRAAVEAALGLSFSSRMMLAVGRACTEHDGWTRIRLQRENERRLSFGLTLALTMKLDMGTGLVQLFEEMTDAVPTPRLVRTARKVLEYGEPEKLKEKLAGEAAEVVEDLVEEHIIDDLGGVIAFSREVVDFYDGLEGELQGLWDRLLSKVDLGAPSGDGDAAKGERIRAWLDRLAALDPSELRSEDLLAAEGDLADLAEVIEALTGKAVEDLLLEDGLDRAAVRVGELAKRAVGLLDGTPAAVLGKIRTFSRKTGIEEIVGTLRTFESEEALGEQVRLRVRRVAERLVGKAWDAIDDGDLEKISGWAERADRYLSFADLDDPESEAGKLAGEIKAHLEEVKLDYGLSLAFEVERIARDTALLDVEVDPDGPGKKLLQPLSEALRRGDVRGALQALVAWESRKEDKADADEEVALPFSIRECVFTSERIRTSALRAVCNLGGLGGVQAGEQSSFTKRVRQASLRIAPRGGQIRRTARHASGFLSGDSPGKMSAGSGVWLITEDSGPGLRPGAGLDAEYDGDPSATLRLVAWYEDRAADATELRALDFLLFDLGLLPDPRREAGAATADSSAPSELVEPGRPLGLSLEVRFPAHELVGDLVARHGSAGGRRVWDLALVNAIHRWADETFVTGTPKGSHTGGKTMGQVLAAVSASSFFVRHGHDVGHLRGELERGHLWNLPVGATVLPLDFEPSERGEVAMAVTALARKRQALPGRLKRLDRAWREAFDPPRDEQGYSRLSRAFAGTSPLMSLHRLNWPNPMSLFWLWLAAITDLRPDALASGRGLALLRHGGPEAEEGEAGERGRVRAYTTRGIPDNRPPGGRIFGIRG